MTTTYRRPRTNDRALIGEGTWTLIGPGSLIRGELLLAGDVMIHGRVEGTIFVDGTVHIAEGAMIEGGVHARRIVVEGRCRGRIEGTIEVILRSGCVVHAEIEAGILTTEEGARVLDLGGAGRSQPKVRTYKPDAPGNA